MSSTDNSEKKLQNPDSISKENTEAKGLATFVQYNSSIGKKILYEPCLRVEDPLAEDIQSLIAEMKTKMSGFGIGLAANQIGRALQIFMIEYNSQPTNPAHTSRYKADLPAVPYQVFINPKITAVSNELAAFWHGCLSALERDKGRLATYKWIQVEALNDKGEPISACLDDLAAVIFQHEFRHLLGSLYIDHAEEFKTAQELADSFGSGLLKPYELSEKGELPHLLRDYEVGDSIEDYAKKK